MKYNGFYYWLFKGTMKKVLAENYNKQYAAARQTATQAYYC